jgi:hypothetical protein
VFIRPYGTLVSRGPGIPAMNRWATITASLRDDSAAQSWRGPLAGFAAKQGLQFFTWFRYNGGRRSFIGMVFHGDASPSQGSFPLSTRDGETAWPAVTHMIRGAQIQVTVIQPRCFARHV